MKHRVLILILVAAVATYSGHLWIEKPLFAGESATPAPDDWIREFEDICAKTQDAMTFNAAELKSLIERSDRLKPRIEKLDETRRKVYLKRLVMCRDLFIFVLESKDKK